MGYKIRKTAEQLENEYYPVGDKGPELGGNADQESEAAEEINEEMETLDQENYTPGNDNLIVDKMDSRDIDPGTILAELKQIAILAKSGYARDLINAAIIKLERIKGE